MRALTFHGAGDIHYESVDDPDIRSGTDAIVRVELAAICGSDLHVYHEREKGLDHGTVMGHEFVGEVVETGSGVRNIVIGARVLSPFTTSCGNCFYCRAGLTARCSKGQLFGWVKQGRGLHGAQAQYVRVPLADGTLLPVPEEVSPEDALLLGDVLCTGYYCASRAGVAPEGTYVVLGCGPVGLAAIVGALEFGARTVLAVDGVPERLALAARFGATPVDLHTGDPGATVDQATDGRGADAVLEVVGSAEAHRLAFDLVRPGGTVSVVGVHHEQSFAFSPTEAYDKNLTYRVGRCPVRHLLAKVIPIVQRKAHDFSAIISHRLRLQDGAEGYRIFDEKRDGCTKVVLRPA